MREILFRGKRVDNGEWVYGAFCPDLLEIEDGREVDWGFIRTYNKITYKMEMIAVDRKTVGQDTNLKDKNGNKIFEGDIVKYNWDNSWCTDNKFHIETCIVEYLQYGFKPFIEDYDCDDGYYSYNIDFNSIEIIGNIHDNKNLIGE